MENKTTIFEPLFESVQAYGKTSYELYKLKAVEKTSGITSSFFSRAIAVCVLLLFVLMASIGVAFWLGDLLGKTHNGFLCVAGFYGITGSVIYFFLHNWIKKRIRNSIISKMLN